MTGFHDVRFPTAISLGSTSGLERRTEIVALVNGHEERNTPWEQARRRFDAGLGVRSLDDLDAVVAFFEARRGRLYAFRWKDWLDHRSGSPSAPPAATDQPLGAGDGTTVAFQLTKTYASGPGALVRPITKPVAGSVLVAVDGTVQAEGADFTLDALSGVVSFASPPAAGAVLTAGFEFDVPARFDTDVLEVNLRAFQAGEVPSIPVLEVR